MIRKWAERIVFIQVYRGILEEDKKVTYVFGYQLLIGKIISGILMILIAGIMGTYWEMLLFMAAFIPLRQYAGGFHFEKAEVCITFSALVSVIIAIGFKELFYTIPLYVWIGVVIVSGIFIWKLGPVDTKNKRLDDIEKKVYACRTKIVLAVELLIFVISVCLQIQMVNIVISIAQFVILGGIITVVIQKFLKIG